MKFILLIIFLIAAYIYYIWNENEKRKTRNEILSFINGLLPDVRVALLQFNMYLKNYDAGYFTNYELTIWKISYANLNKSLLDNPIDNAGLDVKDSTIIKLFLDYYKNSSIYRKAYNKEFTQQELKNYSSLFDNIEKRKLDAQQRMAIVTDEDNNLVISGAGSGKTTTIVGKVGYVINRYKIPPDQILLISFTNKSASTLANRINIEGLVAKTFHKFGMDVIATVEHKQPTIFDETQFNSFITGIFKDLLQNPSYLSKVTSYFTNFLKLIKSQDEFKQQGEYFQFLKDLNYSTYKLKSVPFRGKITFKREVVKSIEECKIANFLLFNGVEYEYEYPYKHDTASTLYRQYKPDFTITNTKDELYIEHFAINKSGKVPHFFVKREIGQTLDQATKEYAESMQWKRELHKQFGTKLIETYSHEMFDDILFDNLTNNLIKLGVQLFPKSVEEIWKIITESAKDEVDNFITLFQTFIVLMKSNNYTLDDVINKNKSLKDKFQKQRNTIFLEIITPIYNRYQDYLADRKEIDFSDMITKATNFIATGKYKRKFSYVIIDEFQDISISRYQLVKAIKVANPACKLFCVGDDWQSIYRFSGSDITLFKEFEKYFGYTEKSKIETTYRFYNPLITLSSNFILKNPNQSRKDLRGATNSKSSNYKIVYSVSENQDDSFALQEIFNELISSQKGIGKTIFILGRYSFDINRIKNEENFFQVDKEKGDIRYPVKIFGRTVFLTATFMTVHKAKGLEADIIIVLNCNSGKHGFPSGISDDPVLNLLLSEVDQFENGEERRLFYVAMTRAKELVYFVADSTYKSKFIIELEMESTVSEIKKCPKCITADLVIKKGVRNGRDWTFFGCTNFIYGCNYREWI